MSSKTDVLEKKLEELKDEYSGTKYNKATNKHLGILRAKIAEVKKDIIESKKGRKGEGYFVKKTGDATIALVGFPSTGKSSIINSVSNAHSKIAEYAFTTTTIIQGTIIYKGAHIQVFDMPGLIEGAHLGLGGGRMVISAMSVADLIVFVIDINNLKQFDQLVSEIAALNIRVNQKRPNIQITKQVKGGLHIEVNRSGLPSRDIEVILQGLGISNANVSIWDKLNDDELIQLISGKARYMNAIAVLNKSDTRNDFNKIAKEFQEKHNIETIPISATRKLNIAKFIGSIYNNLGIISIYLKPKTEEEGHAMILKKGATVGEAARKFHTQIVDELKCAYIKGPSVRFDNQRVGIEHVLQDGDTLTFIKNK